MQCHFDGKFFVVQEKRGKDSRVQHGLVDARVVALLALEGLGSQMIAQVVLQVMLELGHEGTLRAVEALVLFDVLLRVLPEVLLVHGHEGALLAAVLARLAVPHAAAAALLAAQRQVVRLTVVRLI